jgi:hypothetical protein
LNAYLKRLNELTSELMSVELSFVESDLIGPEWSPDDLSQIVSARGRSVPRYLVSDTGQVGIPLLSDGRLLGLVVPAKITDLESKRLSLLSEFVRLTAHEHFFGPEEEDRLVSLAAEQSASYEESTEDLEAPAVALPAVLLSSPSAHRLAVDLHGSTQAWAAFAIDDISEEVFATPNGLRELGHITIFIPDLAAVPLKKQLRIAEQLASNGSRLQVIANLSGPDRRIIPHLLEAFLVVPGESQRTADDIRSWLATRDLGERDPRPLGQLLSFPTSTLH